MLVNQYTNKELQSAFFPDDLRIEGLAMQANDSLAAGTVVGIVTTAAASDVQTLAVTGTPTGGSFGLLYGSSYGPQYIASNIPYNATAAQVQAALQALPNIGAGNVTCTGGALPGTAVVITFSGDFADQPQPVIQVVQAAFTGGSSPAATITHTTTGVANGAIGAYASGNTDGTQKPIGILMAQSVTDGAGNVTFGAVPGSAEFGRTFSTTNVAIRGYFNTGDLTGLDSTAVGDLGRLVQGTTMVGVLSMF